MSFLKKSTSIVAKNKAVWDPDSLKYIAAFCTMVPGSILYSINYLRLGHPKKLERILATFGVTIILIIIAFVTPNNAFFYCLFLVVNVVISIYFAYDQRDYFEEKMNNKAKKASIILPAILSIIFLILPILLFLYFKFLS